MVRPGNEVIPTRSKESIEPYYSQDSPPRSEMRGSLGVAEECEMPDQATYMPLCSDCPCGDTTQQNPCLGLAKSHPLVAARRARANLGVSSSTSTTFTVPNRLSDFTRQLRILSISLIAVLCPGNQRLASSLPSWLTPTLLSPCGRASSSAIRFSVASRW